MTIVERVKRLCAEYETRDPFALCAACGFFVSFHNLGRFRGYMVRRHGICKITLSDRLPPMAARFVCAHELGHALLHRRINRVFLDAVTKTETGRFENEADKFAAQLLFGAPPLFAEPITAFEMADILNVPLCNVDTRLIELEIYH